MKVLKKDGNLQPFDLSKIIFVLERISDECHQPFTRSDLSLVSKNIEKTIKKSYKGIIPTSTIRAIVIEELEKAGFNLIANSYKEYVKEFN